MNNILIKKLTEANLYYFKEISDFVFDGKKVQKYLNQFIEDDNCYGFVAQQNGKVVGFAYSYRLKRLESKPMMYIHSIDVLESYRKQGIGKKLISHIVDYSIKNDFKSCFLITNKTNYSACKLYESTGGKVISVDDVLYKWIF